MNNRRSFLKKLGLGSLVISICGVSSYSRNFNKKPNLIFILADDLGFGDLGCYDSKKILTPNLDKLASNGMKFTQFYAGSAVCTPTRVSCITGRYPLRFNISQHFDDREMHLPENTITLPKLLKKAKYISKHIGKWHLGGLNVKHTEDRINSIPGPLEHGFDHYLAMYEDPAIRLPAMLENRLYKDGAKHLVSDDKPKQKSNMHWTDYKIEEAIRFIESSNKKDEPFFLNLWLDAPHAPYEPAPGKSIDLYKEMAKHDDLYYRSMVTNLDKGVGKIIEKLIELGIDENTLVIFTSDNGPAYQGSPGPLKGRKGDLHEGGIRVPMIAYWPGIIEGGSTSNILTHTNDILPTFCTVADIDVPTELKIDGINILPILQNKSPQLDNRTLFWQIKLYKNNYNVVQDKKPKPYATEIIRKGKWKLLANNGIPVELFNMDEDPYERWNLMETWPNITTKLTDKLNVWLNEPRTSKELAGIPKEKTKITRITHLAKDCNIKNINNVDIKYTKNGLNVLTDGIRATSDISDGYWVGVESNDLELLIDLGKIEQIKEISVGCIEDQKKWIFLPQHISFFISTNNINFSSIESIPCFSHKDVSIFIETFTKQIKPTYCRYIKLLCKNIHICPDGHIGAGKPAWMFLDEIIIN